jgi:hypothetical protein
MTDLIKAAKLWSKTSAKTARPYLVGRWGDVKVAVVPVSPTRRNGGLDATPVLLIGSPGATPVDEAARPPVCFPHPSRPK